MPKRELCYRGKFHGFFQSYTYDSDGELIHFPIATIEKSNGTVRTVRIELFAFDEPLGILAVLADIPKYKTHKAERCLN